LTFSLLLYVLLSGQFKDKTDATWKDECISNSYFPYNFRIRAIVILMGDNPSN